MRALKLRVYSTSGPSWQPVKNGQPYNKWVGTIQFSDVEHVFLGHRFSATVVGDTKEEAEKQLDQYQWGEIIEIDPSKLNADPILGGSHANTTR